jgi:Tol biopolymer transport system component
LTLPVGSKLGPYEIAAPIGAGGMGEVYRAKDPRLSRDVAIKVLPASFSADADRLRRFEQEAKAAGVLNHPNITAVYDIGSSADGAPYVVQELLEGETLRSELAGGKFSPRKAIDYGTQIAEGLAAAHEKGIVHRDLKPENVFVTKDGRVKILDFGLAKLTQVEGSGSSGTNLPTETKGTEPGVVLGTLGYMSPEQVRGRPADARSDIFSFGAILYEMLSGKRAFHGDSAADTMSAILREDPPDLSVTNQSVSPGLERIVRHCIEKNPERRFQSARDLAFNLGELSGASGSVVGAQPGRARRTFPWLPLLGAVALTAAFAAGHFLWKAPEASTPTYRRLTFRRGNIGTARFAPDGRSVVYSASLEGGPLEIYTTRPEGPESTPIGVKNADLFSVSPSGELAISVRERFLAGPSGVGTLATVPIGGGAPRAIAEFVDRAVWMPDGKQLAIQRYLEGLNRIELPLGKVIYATEHGIRVPRISPRGDRFAFAERIAGRPWIRTVDLAGKSTTLVGPVGGQGIAWSPSGEEIWFDDRGERGQYFLKAVDLSGRTRVLATLPVGLVVHDVSGDGQVLVERYDSKPGVVVLAPGDTRERDLTWFDRSALVGLSDDGRIALLNEFGDAAGINGAHYLRKTDGSPAVKLGEGSAMDLSADGKWVLARKPGSETAMVLTPTGTGAPVVIDASFESHGGAVFFPDGKRLLIQAAEPGKKRRLYVMDLPSGKPRPIAKEGYGIGFRPISPDGQWIVAYGEWSEDMHLVPISGGEPRTIPNTKDLDLLQWTPDGKFLYATLTGSIPAQLVRVEVATGRREPWKTLAPADLSGLIDIDPICVTPDGKSYAFGYGRSATSDLYVIEGLK